jgi:hypothetical protein
MVGVLTGLNSKWRAQRKRLTADLPGRVAIPFWWAHCRRRHAVFRATGGSSGIREQLQAVTHVDRDVRASSSPFLMIA